MAINVALYKNNLTNDGSQYARVVETKLLSFDSLLEYMCSKGSGLEKADMEGAVKKFRDAVLFYLLLGHKVATPLGIFAPRVSSGAMQVNGHIPEVERETAGITYRADSQLVKDFRLNLKFDNDGPRQYQRPKVLHVSNVEENVEDSSVLPTGAVGHIIGKRVSFRKAQEDEGVFFVSEADPQTEVRIQTYAKVGSTHLYFVVAGIPAGRYFVEVRNRTTPEGELRTGIYEEVVEVT